MTSGNYQKTARTVATLFIWYITPSKEFKCLKD